MRATQDAVHVTAGHDAVEKGTRAENGFTGLLHRFNDPRIHAAVVCASVSCPDLARDAFTADNVEALLDDRVRAWLGPWRLS